VEILAKTLQLAQQEPEMQQQAITAEMQQQVIQQAQAAMLQQMLDVKIKLLEALLEIPLKTQHQEIPQKIPLEMLIVTETSEMTPEVIIKYKK
jgi:hypothetical protein